MARRHRFDYDLIVIGSGIAGHSAAFAAIDEGKRVAVVDFAERLGGYTVNAEIPRHALLQSARVYAQAKNGGQFGIRGTTVGYNYPTIKAWQESVYDEVSKTYAHAAYVERGIDIFAGRAHFVSPNEITVDRRHISAQSFVIATGSVPRIPHTIHGLEKINYLTAYSALALLKPPKSVFIIGGGATGVEFAQLFATFGSKVSITEIAPRLLPNEDVEAGDLLGNALTATGNVDVLTSTRVTRVAKDGLVIRVTYLRGDVEHSLKVDSVLLASGSAPATDIGLENAGVEYANEGVFVNEALQTSTRHIFAAGDVIDSQCSPQTARYEGKLAVHNLYQRDRISVDYATIPIAVATSPTIARVGINEQDALRKDVIVQKFFIPASISRAVTAGYGDSFAKLIVDKKGLLIGATVAGPHADDLIGQVSLAMQAKMSAQTFSEQVRVFGSWSELFGATPRLAD